MKENQKLVAVIAFTLIWSAEVYSQDERPANTYGHEYRYAALESGLPMEYQGDGFRFVIDSVDSSCSEARGTVSASNGMAMKYSMQLQPNGESGIGEVRTASGFKSLQAWNRGSGKADVVFDGERYSLQEQNLLRRSAHSKRRQSSDDVHKKVMAMMTIGDEVEDVDERAKQPESAPATPSPSATDQESQEIKRQMQEMMNNMKAQEEQNRESMRKVTEMARAMRAGDAQRLSSSWCISPRH
ncbi:MAG: hypothetical protein AAF438_22320 [Pseudomonadota bacterium]